MSIVLLDGLNHFYSLLSIRSAPHTRKVTSTTATRPTTPSRLSHRPGFWIVAAVFLAVMAFSTVPTPLYAIYQARDGFPTWVITVIFAVYAVGVIASLLFVGHLSDWFGRRRMALFAVLAELLAAAIFLAFPSVPGLVVARFVSGLGVGALTAAATAHLGELRAIARPGDPGRAGVVATVVNTGGLALGPLIAGALAQFAPAPLELPYAVFAVILIVGGILLSLVPETVTAPDPRPAYRPQRARIPEGSRSTFAAAGVAAFTGFAVFGFFTALAPTVLAATMGETSRLVAGVAVFVVFAASAAAQIVFAALPAARQRTLGVVGMAVGLVLLVASAILGHLPLFLLAGIVAGAGVGLVFRDAISTAGSLAGPGNRGEVLAAMFLIAYLGLVVPVLGIGVALIVWPVIPVLVVFAAAVAVLVVAAGVRLTRR